MNAKSTDEKILGALLRSELNALESYREAIRRFPELAAHPLIEGIRSDHSRAAETLRALINAQGGDPPREAQPWNLLNLEKTARVLDPPAQALAVFKIGEKETVSLYQSALKDSDLPLPAQAVIRDELLPLAWKNWLYVETLVA